MSPSPDPTPSLAFGPRCAVGFATWISDVARLAQFRWTLKPQSQKFDRVRRHLRRLAVLLMVLGAFALSQPLANASPSDVTTLPDNLRQYVAGTPEWAASPWMTAQDCRDQGGDWSIYTQHVLNDTPALLEFFQPDFGGQDSDAKARGAEILQGYRDIAAQITVPAGYCVNRVKQWAGSDPNYKPFGFDWGDAAPGPHTTGYVCDNNVGADHAPCGGFYVSCTGATTQQQHAVCQSWNDFSDNYVNQVQAARAKAISDHPGNGEAPVITVPKSLGEIMQDILNWTVTTGMEQVVGFVLDGVLKLWGIFLKVIVNFSEPNVAGAGFATVYNLVAGVALAMAFLGWLASLAAAWRQGRLAFSLLGGVKAAVGITLAGVGAIFMVQLANECTASLAHASGNLAGQADWTGSLVKANPLVGLIAGILIALFLIFAIIFLVVHGPLVLMWALMGAIAAAGQVHTASSGWLLKWASRGTALAWVPFVMIGEMDLSVVLLLPVNAGEDTVKQIVDIGQGLVLGLSLASTPFLLFELIDFVGDRAGGVAASGGKASQLASAGTGRVASSGGSAVNYAVSTMMSTAADIGRQMRDGFREGLHGGGSSGDGSGSPRVPRAEDSGQVGNAGQFGEGNPPNGGGSPGRPPSGPSGSDGGDCRPAANRGRVVANSTGHGSSGRGGACAGGRAAPPIPPV